MHHNRDRDRAVERLLPQALADVSRDAAGGCIDAERLAAWTSGTLRAEEAAQVEAHLADCADCQDVLGILVRTAPPPIRVRGRDRWHLRWLVPLATAATAVALYLLVPGRAPAPAPAAETMISDAQPRRDLPLVPEPQAQRQELASAAETGRLDAAPPENQQAAPGRAEAKDATGRAAVDQSALAASAPAREIEAPPGIAAPKQASPPPGGNLQPKTLEERVAVLPPAATARPAASAAPASRAPAPATPAPTAPAEAALPPADAVAGRRADALFRMMDADIHIATPEAAHRFRIVGGQRVERTTTAGRTWESLARPAGGEMLAGAAPAIDVCWIVGRGGAVWRTTDGQRLERLSFPQSVDLVAVAATSAMAASVTAADGRTFQTADGGQTWTPR